MDGARRHKAFLPRVEPGEEEEEELSEANGDEIRLGVLVYSMRVLGLFGLPPCLTTSLSFILFRPLTIPSPGTRQGENYRPLAHSLLPLRVPILQLLCVL